MVQNGILLTFTRLVCLCFLDVRLSFLCLSLSHPPESCTSGCPFQNLPKPKPEDSRTIRFCLPPRHATVPDMGLLFMGLNLHPLQYIMYIMLCSICLFPLVYSLVGGFLFPTHLAFCFHCLLVCPSASFYVCVESLLEIRWTWRISQRDGLFSALNEIWQLEYAIHNLIYPPNWKAREELNVGEGSAVCFADLGQHLKCSLGVWSPRWPMCTVDSTVPRKLSQDVIEVTCNNNSTQVRCFQGGHTLGY